MTPDEQAQAKFARLTKKLQKALNLEESTEHLGNEDYEFIGRLIQAYCIADYCSRRIITAMRFIATETEIDAAKLSDKDVIEHLLRCGKGWTGQQNIGDGVQAVAKTLEMHRHIRHSFAHFAARRISDEDAFLLLTTSGNHKEPPSGVRITEDIPNEPHEGSHRASFRVVPLEELRDELRKLQEHAQFLSHLAYYLETNLIELKDKISSATPP